MKIRTLLLFAALASQTAFSQSKKILFEKITLDSTYVSEAACTGDIDRDGRVDIIAGDVW